MTNEIDKKIPTLEDVVEIGAGAAAADAAGQTDTSGDQFEQLFEDDAQTSIPMDLDSMDDELAEQVDDELWGSADMQMVEQQHEQVSSAPADDSDDDLKDISLNAQHDTVEADAQDDLWIDDWQEDINESSPPDDTDTRITHVDDADRDEVEVDETLTEIKAAHEGEPDTAGAASGHAVADDSELSRAFGEIDDIPLLVNEIVGEIMPEIEWKLKTRIREILEERLSRDD